ncbi:lysylphosphatidylglycerol synthase domain-containing protein [Chelatococcus reniformis]|uniref:lysylphosphatidylglycerol synthase domain-containing protein n=1 Tax=Chelatococcus reniformis TaxID=1494448 RepID=UPI001AED5A63|nr:lysylphosphatidylglycerol synthase domain-containing protein [Chelatococcus reniformis]
MGRKDDGSDAFPGLRSGLRYGGILLLLLCLVFAALALLIGGDMGEMRRVVASLPAALAVSAGVHIPQIVLTACAWRCLLPKAGRPSVPAMTMLRWFRETASTLLPAGALVGQVAAARLLTRWGVPGKLSAATATMDVTLESVSQGLFTLLGLALLVVINRQADLLGVAVAGAGLGVAGIVALVLLQGGRSLRWAENLLLRLFPRLRLEAFHSFRLTMAEVRRAHGSLAWAMLWHSIAWVLGAVEICGILALLGHPIDLSRGLIIESLSQAMRIAGFMLPGSVIIQEGAIVAAAALAGVSPEAAVVVALVRRARELAISLLGLVAWAGVERADARQRLATLSQGR